MLEYLAEQGLKVTGVPATATADEIAALGADGVFLSDGPGDPKAVSAEILAEIKKIFGTRPVFAACLGHQLAALALGADTFKLKFGHRGASQPVKELETGRVQISTQNHGYAVDAASLEGTGAVITHRNVNDDTVEGMRHAELSLFSVQYYPEPTDYLFAEFLSLVNKGE